MLRLLLDIYSLVVLAAVVVSWMPLDEGHPLVRWTRRATEPALRPIRKVLPTAGGFDFSPLVLLLGLHLLRRIV